MNAPAEPAAPIRVLVVDDQELVRLGFCVILDAADGITVVGEAANGEAAVSQVAAHAPDVVLMDIRMPGMDGLEATAEIRDRERTTGEHVPIVAMTAHAMKGDREKCLEAGASEYLAKPVNTEQLLAALRMWLHR